MRLYSFRTTAPTKNETDMKKIKTQPTNSLKRVMKRVSKRKLKKKTD